ncbi:hypothetical protein ACFO3J_16180 [Streptomyces polygonati]|uniref:Integral membrane protein n=1 Tax=Streptomyces polygonati TaxID=1617087 RepID=A0ABV8HSZ9_9ACTN
MGTGEEEQAGKGRRLLNSWWVTALFAGVLWLGFRLLAHDGVVAAVISAVFYGGFMALAAVMGRRRVSRSTGVDAKDLPRLSRQARRGEVPEDPEQRRLMGQLVRWQLGKLHDVRRAVMAFAALFVIVVGSAVLWFVAGHPVAGLCWLVGGLAFLAFLLWNRRRSQARLTRVDRRLNGLDHGQAHGRAHGQAA